MTNLFKGFDKMCILRELRDNEYLDGVKKDLILRLKKARRVRGEFKKCCQCFEILLPENFYKRKDTKDGLQSHCKLCERNRSKF